VLESHPLDNYSFIKNCLRELTEFRHKTTYEDVIRQEKRKSGFSQYPPALERVLRIPVLHDWKFDKPREELTKKIEEIMPRRMEL